MRTANWLCFGGWHCCCVAYWDRRCLNMMDRLGLEGGGDTGATRGPADKCQKF